MPRPRFNKLSEQRRRELLERAAGEFALHGYEAASLNGIITGIGLSKGAFYYYFDDKADLFATVTRFAFDSLIGPAPAYDFQGLDRKTFWPGLEGWFVQHMARVHQTPWLAGLGKLLYDPPTVDGVDSVVANHFDQIGQWLTSLLRHGREVGAIRDDVPLELLQAMVVGAMEASDRWFVNHWDELGIERQDELAALTFAVAKRMIATPSTTPASKKGRTHNG